MLVFTATYIIFIAMIVLFTLNKKVTLIPGDVSNSLKEKVTPRLKPIQHYRNDLSITNIM